ncbi:recombinase family protein [Sporosarcina luteola]|uniref:recombinase family protein n=1 Tax=Sporosarcina luteola TaxID=582850 RepID=UPI00204224DF|nr:recombinase family protein [Sporosarcina luteola]MCM3742937.1 recombinase family protein [Sporosarcina luteola]
MTVYGYARVSTKGQDLEAQIQALEGEKVEHIYQEKFTGTKRDRPEFTKMLDELKAGDKIVVTKLDRFARSTIDALTTINALNEGGIDLVVLDMGGEKIDTSTASGKLLFTIMSGFAEFEREMIIQRTQEGKAIARQNPNYREGRKPTYTKAQLDHALGMLVNHSYNQVAEKTGISKSTLIRAMKKRKAEEVKLDSK